jgi:hypothetical protein
MPVLLLLRVCVLLLLLLLVCVRVVRPWRAACEVLQCACLLSARAGCCSHARPASACAGCRSRCCQRCCARAAAPARARGRATRATVRQQPLHPRRQ